MKTRRIWFFFYIKISSIHSVFFLTFSLDYGLTNTDRLYEYISARMYGEHTGDCETAYPQCPFSAFNLLNPEEIMNVLGNTIWFDTQPLSPFSI